VQVRSAARCRAVRIGYDGRVALSIRAGDHAQQLALGGPLPASDARAHRRLRWGDVFVNHQPVTLPGAGSG